MYIGEIIRAYRTKNQLSQRRFASRTTLSPSYINMLEKIFNPKNGKPYSVTTDVAKELAVAMNMTIEELLSKIDDGQEFTTNSTIPNNKRLFPILGEVKAGYDMLSFENTIGYITVDRDLGDPENYYALKIKGDSMAPILNEDDIVVVHKQNNVENGNVAIVLIDDEEATVKRIYKTEKGIKLEAFNPYYPTREFTVEEIEDKPVKIIGKVIEARIKKIFE